MSVILVMAECTTSTRLPVSQAPLDDQRDVSPVGERGDAGAAELDDDPRDVERADMRLTSSRTPRDSSLIRERDPG